MTTQNIPVSQFPVAIQLSGQEEVPIVQGGVTKRTTTGAIAVLGSSASYPTPNFITTGGITTVMPTNFGDYLVNVAALVTIQLPPAASRGFVPITVADIGGFAGTYNITILPFGTETIMGLASLTISTPRGTYTVAPVPGVGWYQKG